MYAQPTLTGSSYAPTAYGNISTFGSTSSQIIPVPAVLSNGYLAGQGFPAENENYLMYNITNAINNVTNDVANIHAEILNVLGGALSGSVSPNNNNNQLYAALQTMILNVAHPIGAVYAQLPGESAPNVLWGGTWHYYGDGTLSTLGGVFFRTEGGNSSNFTSGQQAQDNQPHTHGTGTLVTAGPSSYSHNHTISDPGHSHVVWGKVPGGGSEFNAIMNTGSGSYVATSASATATLTGITATNDVASGALMTHTHSISGSTGNFGTTETRPINITVRMWKRTA